MADHTPEPWRVEPFHEKGRIFVYAEQNTSVAEVEEQFGFIDTYPPDCTDWALMRANADRIVACVNACAGIRADALQKDTIQRLLSLNLQMLELMNEGKWRGRFLDSAHGQLARLLGELGVVAPADQEGATP